MVNLFTYIHRHLVQWTVAIGEFATASLIMLATCAMCVCVCVCVCVSGVCGVWCLHKIYTYSYAILNIQQWFKWLMCNICYCMNQNRWRGLWHQQTRLWLFQSTESFPAHALSGFPAFKHYKLVPPSHRHLAPQTRLSPLSFFSSALTSLLLAHHTHLPRPWSCSQLNLL